MLNDSRQVPESFLDKQSAVQTVIVPPHGWFRFNPVELWNSRYLIALFVYRDFVIYYKQTILGPLWWLIQPLFATGVFTIVFSMAAQISTDDIPPPLFYFSGLILWNYFASCLSQISRVLLDNRDVLGKVYFPRLVIPIALVLSNLLRWAVQVILFVLIYVVYWVRGAPIQPNLFLILLPLVMLYLLLLGLGLGLLVAAVTVRYRDLVLAIPFLTQLGMLISTVIVPLSAVPESWRFWCAFNPIIVPIELFRLMTLGTGIVSWTAVLIGLFLLGLILLLGLGLFSRAEQTFTDAV
ncbi:MAG: ABC transporter permease [Planctomycetaceae bacterium]|jgi:lipopolysaccharide transport system permease protein|nr:ABC transporter permease [Planctomycetaceae bacterium]